MPVERHRRDAQILGQPPDGDGVQTLGVGELQGVLGDGRPAQPVGNHLTTLQRTGCMYQVHVQRTSTAYKYGVYLPKGAGMGTNRRWVGLVAVALATFMTYLD